MSRFICHRGDRVSEPEPHGDAMRTGELQEERHQARIAVARMQQEVGGFLQCEKGTSSVMLAELGRRCCGRAFHQLLRYRPRILLFSTRLPPKMAAVEVMREGLCAHDERLHWVSPYSFSPYWASPSVSLSPASTHRAPECPVHLGHRARLPTAVTAALASRQSTVSRQTQPRTLRCWPVATSH